MCDGTQSNRCVLYSVDFPSTLVEEEPTRFAAHPSICRQSRSKEKVLPFHSECRVYKMYRL